MVHFGVVKDFQGRAARTRLRIGSPVNDTSQTGLNDGAGAHGARFNCNIEVATFQPVVPKLFGGAAQGQDLRVSSGVGEPKGTIVRSRDHLVVLDHDCPHRNFSLGFGLLRFPEGAAHEIRVCGGECPR